jgi:hypothetical protein
MSHSQRQNIAQSHWFTFWVGTANIVSAIFAVLAYYVGPPITAQDIPTTLGTGDVLSAFRVMVIVSFTAIVLFSLQALIGHYVWQTRLIAGFWASIEYGINVPNPYEDNVHVRYHSDEIKFFIRGIRLLSYAFITVVFGLAARILLRLFFGY